MTAPSVGAPRFRAVIVDDEPTARDVIRTLLASAPRVEIVGEAANGRQAVALVRETHPDLMFLDVQMPDMDGFAVLESLGADVPRGVVLVTAYDQYAQRAFEVHALDYVQKPFGRPRFAAALERALHRLQAEDALGLAETLQALIHGMRADPGGAATLLGAGGSEGAPAKSPGLIGVRVGTRTTLVDVADIDWIEADGELVKVNAGGKLHLVKGRLRDFEERLEGRRFLRVHRSVIVNLDRVRVLNRERDGSGSVVLTNGVQLRVARARWEALEAALGLDLKG